MDIVKLTHDLTPFLIPLLPYLAKAGEKAAEEAGKKLAGDAWDKAKAIWAWLWPKVEARPAALEAVMDAAKTPTDEEAQTVLRVQLKKLLAKDEAAAQEIERLFSGVAQAGGSQVSAADRSAAFGDRAKGNVVNTGTVQGDVFGGDKS